jgi:FdhD protein
VPGAPTLTAADGRLLREINGLDESGGRRTLQIPVERPLTIRVNGRELVTLMTLGAKAELLVVGYLRNQRIIESVKDIESIRIDWAASAAAVALRPTANEIRVDTHRPLGTACGLGTEFADLMMKVDAVVMPNAGTARLSGAVLLRILEIMREYDAVHRAAGSVHGCALFHGADLLASIEDVSRHNGLDIVTGWMLLHGVTGADKTLFTTGRLTGEMVMKAAHNGVPIMVSRNGVTSMGYDLGVRLGMTLFGRAAKNHYLCYTGAERFGHEPVSVPT